MLHYTIIRGENMDEIQSSEILEEALSLTEASPAQVNEFGCICGPEDLCELCSEPIEAEYLTDEDGGEEKVYKHISEFRGTGLGGPALQSEQQSEFRRFISRVTR